MNNALTVCYTDTFKQDVKTAINWKSKSIGSEQARDLIKSLLQDFDNQMRLFPESGKIIDFAPVGDRYSEIIKGDYRFVIKSETIGEQQTIYALMFCHQRMDYETLYKQRQISKLLG